MAAPELAEVEDKSRFLFLDVFRRADKNDDGAISWDEFKAYFADGVLTNEELKNLFDEIDTHNTNKIDVEELCTYFTQHLGPFDDLLEKIESLNLSVTGALNASAMSYPSASFVEQYWTRFLLREILGQLSAVQGPIDSASDALEERAVQDRKDTLVEGEMPQATMDLKSVSSTPNIIPGRVGRRMRRQISSQTSWAPEAGAGSTALGQQVDRLKSLIDRMEKQVCLTGGQEEELNIEDEQLVMLVYRKMCVHEAAVKSFRNQLKSYIDVLTPDAGCLQFTRSSTHKEFQHSKIDMLELPESLNSMPIPESWWSTA